MKCDDCQELIQQRLDGLEPADQASLEQHLRACPACRALHVGVGRLQQGLALLRPPMPPPALAGRIAAALRTEHRSRLARRRVVFALAAAAAVLLVLSGWLLRPAPQRDQGPGHPDNQANNLPTPLPEKKPAEEPMDLEQSVQEVGSAVVSAATRTTDAAVAQGRTLLPPMPSAPSTSLDVPALEPARSLKQAGQGVSEGLAPVTDSARRAFDLFLRDLPPVALEDKPGL